MSFKTALLNGLSFLALLIVGTSAYAHEVHHFHGPLLRHTRQRHLGDSKPAWRPIRIRLDTSLIPNRSSDVFTLAAHSVLGRTLDYLGQLLKVAGPTAIPELSNINCIKEPLIPDGYKKSLTDADFILFLQFDELMEGAVASSEVCLISTFDCRPLAGVLRVNPNKLRVEYPSLDGLHRLFLRELFFMFAFDRFLFDKSPSYYAGKLTFDFVASYDNEDQRFLRVRSEKLLEFGKAHFGCADFEGLIMENTKDRYDKSRLSSRLFGNEVSSSAGGFAGVVSGFSLHFLEAMGWYEVDFALEEPLAFGRAAGCQFFRACDRERSEFCSFSGAEGCAGDRLRRTTCQLSSRFDKCAVPWLPS